jgi:hypothetical protein
MEIPLVLTAPRPERLVYALPVWYRMMMGFILTLVATALIMTGSWPGFLAWTILVILTLCMLYEDTWTFDAKDGRAVHRAGLLIGARSTVIELSAIEQFRIVPYVKGTIPGSEEEKAENAAALEGKRTDDDHLKRSRHKKPFLILEINCADGTRYLIDHIPARSGAKLRAAASQLGTLCGKPVVEV